jgi:hypothetical protein
MSTYDPPEGERVEVLFEEEQESWWEGEVRTKKGSFFVIAFPDEGDSETSELVERERLRPRSGHVPSGFMRRMFPIPRGMEQNVKATEAQLPKLAKHAELFALCLSPDGKSLVGIGQARALETAQGLLDMHMKRLPRLAQMAMEEQALMATLQQTAEQKNFGGSGTPQGEERAYSARLQRQAGYVTPSGTERVGRGRGGLSAPSRLQQRAPSFGRGRENELSRAGRKEQDRLRADSTSDEERTVVAGDRSSRGAYLKCAAADSHEQASSTARRPAYSHFNTTGRDTVQINADRGGRIQASNEASRFQLRGESCESPRAYGDSESCGSVYTPQSQEASARSRADGGIETYRSVYTPKSQEDSARSRADSDGAAKFRDICLLGQRLRVGF